MTTTYPEKPGYTDVGLALDAYRQAWETRDEALLARIAELEKPADPPTPPAFMTGSSRPDRLPDSLRPVEVARTYLGVNKRPTNYSQDSGLVRAAQLSTKAIALSWKDAPGAWLDELLDSLAPFTVYGTQNHEPADDIEPAEYHDRWDVYVDIAARYDNVHTTTIVHGWKPESWETYYRPDAEVLGVDRYNYPLDKPDAYHNPDDIYGAFLDFAASKGNRRVLVGETGSRLVAGTSEAKREEHYRECREYLRFAGVEVACLWLGSPDFIAPAATLGAFLNG